MPSSEPLATFERRPLASAPDGAARAELALKGRVYADVCPQLRDELTRAVEGGARELLIDATHLEQIDSAGLNEFVQLLRRLRPQGGKIVFFGLSPSIQRVFDITKLNKVMGVAASREDALGGLAS
ncbi:MAG: STAS domain-containing protein [Planctomycetes bacterium]|nr:STAS domain-containing protein [Planctomycetota bacterium]